MTASTFTYTSPVNWTDKGMDWNNPDPFRADYAVAISLAITERYRALQKTVPKDLFKCGYKVPVSYAWIKTVQSAIYGLANMFVNADKELQESETFPYYTVRDFTDAGLAELPIHYSPDRIALAKFFKAAKKCIDMLHTKPVEVKYELHDGTGSIHDPPFSQAVSESISEAMEESEDIHIVSGTSINVGAYSASTHYTKTEKDDNGNKIDGYCGYADITYLKVLGIENYYVEGNTFVLIRAYRREETAGRFNGDEMQSNQFNSGNSDLTQNTSVKLPLTQNMTIGSTTIPRTSKPSSILPDEDEKWDDEKHKRRTTITGYEAKGIFCVDCAVDGGFKFYEKS